MLYAYTLRIPPVISLPQVMPPHGPWNLQPNTTMFWEGILTRRPSSSRPDLMAMQSSYASSVQFLITTWSQDSGSHPSVCEWLVPPVVTPSIVTLRHSVGCNCQNCDCLRVTPSISTFVQL